MSLTLKISSLVIRTLSKPIANQIKAQAREHERFRHICVSMAQAMHRFDMRLRLGSIRDTTASRKQAEAQAAAKKHIPTSPTVKTEAATKAEEEAVAKAKAAAEEAAKPQHYRIRPLSESKAIESGANFISETFLFLVAGGLIVFESWRSRRKESTRREGVEDRLMELEQSEKTAREALVALEKELLALKAKHGETSQTTKRILPREVYEVNSETEQPVIEESWWSTLTSYLSFGPSSVSNPPAASSANPTSNSTDAKTITSQPATSSVSSTPTS
ncbi:hypothetical protein N7462_000694 [Penicillium macrosclerotiorum]|uniref:uncharacterized protein n=1 Tax=Penicillium macrosclerotiorum TaxID=303699 RepID=UPI002547869B|nr:uncharacterized protein N7462_000694 [Penicillium macrosclerotiorum]KAJ5698689.1 hypothetical protein N7462_000694 [Penicillium macrosclerotiorum]